MIMTETFQMSTNRVVDGKLVEETIITEVRDFPAGQRS